jgi:hypothetical protein
VRVLLTFADLEPIIAKRKAARYAKELMPDYPTSVPAGLLPAEWLEPLRQS